MSGSLAAIDRYLGERGVSQWLVGKRMTQADITAVCVFTFLNDTLRVAADPGDVPVARDPGARCESLPAFQETRVPFLSRIVRESLARIHGRRPVLHVQGAAISDVGGSPSECADAGQLAAES
jgi:hypothetical protein